MATKEDAKSVQHGAPARRPEVIVEFLFDRGLLFICVNNTGERAAMDVSVTFAQKIVGLGGTKEISSLPLFRSLQFLGPKREIKTFLDTTASYFQRKQPTRITARISYHDADSTKFEASITHNLEVYRDLAYLDPADLTQR